ncbi:uncharacterized protein [Eurosta solidaginis]|uniref:uncharacterized protein n=1 Tax=Eurosta solidaginis TaxID=178769 RepID=UPI003530B86D
MFKLSLIISTIFALASARPGYLHGHYPHIEYPLLHHHHEPLHLTKYVHIPAAISHQSSTVIHSAPIIKPVVVPVLKTVVHPIIKTYHPAPIIKAYHPISLDPYHHHDHFDHHALHHFH